MQTASFVPGIKTRQILSLFRLHRTNILTRVVPFQSRDVGYLHVLQFRVVARVLPVVQRHDVLDRRRDDVLRPPIDQTSLYLKPTWAEIKYPLVNCFFE